MAPPASHRTATVIGGSGFIGRYVIQVLAEAGIRVVCGCRHPELAGRVRTCGTVGQITPVFCNVTEADNVRAVVEGANIVINLTGALFERGSQSFAALHGEAPGIIARAAAEAGARRFIHISAIGASADSAAAYARSKAAGEVAARAAFPGTTILRPSIVFGPEDGFFNLFAGLARISPVLPLIGGGRMRFQPVYVGDVAAAVMACLEDAGTAGRTFELGGPAIYSFADLLRLILAVTRRRRPLVPLPFRAAALKARILELLPRPLLTRDQLVLLRTDNLVGEDAAGLADLGVTPTSLEPILPTYLARYRPGGRFAEKAVVGLAE